eukprot:COSAG02_NODE_1553_length_11961_cov_5.094335_11_plen_85_part_00
MTWKEETQTEWETVTETVPCRVHETTVDEVVVTTTRNGILESEDRQVRKFPFRSASTWSPGRLGRCAAHARVPLAERAWLPATD